MPAIDSGLLSIFAEVARSGGITRASSTLNTVPSNLTAKIRQLETALDVPLFERHSRGMSLTTAGAQLLPYAVRVESLLAEARRAATNTTVPSGRLMIGAMETTAAIRLPPALLAYSKAFPQVDLVLRTGTSRELVQDVIDHKLEGALVAGPVERSELVAEPIVAEQLVLVTASGFQTIGEALCQGIDHPGARETDEFKIIVFRAGCSYRRMLETFLVSRGVSRLRVLELGTLEGILGCAAAGLGVTMLPKSVAELGMKTHDIRWHPLPGEEAGRVETMFVFRKDVFQSSALLQFLTVLRDANLP